MRRGRRAAGGRILNRQDIARPTTRRSWTRATAKEEPQQRRSARQADSANEEHWKSADMLVKPASERRADSETETPGDTVEATECRPVARGDLIHCK